MAGPFALAAALSRVRRIRCPHCGQEKAVTRPAAYRVCPRCHRKFTERAAERSGARSGATPKRG